MQNLHVLVHLNQTWTFPVNEITITVPKIWGPNAQKYRIKVCSFFTFLVCFYYLKFSLRSLAEDFLTVSDFQYSLVL